MKFKKIGILALALMCASNLLTPKRSEALVLGLVSGNVPLAIAGGLIAWPGCVAGFGIGAGIGWLISPFNEDVSEGVGAGGAIAFGVVGIILDDEGKPISAMNVNKDLVEKVGAQQGYSADEIQTIVADVAQIDEFIDPKSPVKSKVSALVGVKDVSSASYQKKYSELAKNTATLLTDRVNAERAKKGLAPMDHGISELTARFAFAMNGITS